MRWILLVMVAAVGGLIGAMAFRAKSAGNVRPATEPASVSLKPSANTTTRATPAKPAQRGAIHFEEIARRLGIQFAAFTGTTPEKHFPTANGTGVAMLDFDQDGYLDLYFANAARLDGDPQAPPNVLLRSERCEAFVDVTAQSTANIHGFTQGLAASDVNNDGFPDIYLLRYGPNTLLQNNGDGTFSDRTEPSGLGDLRWGTSAAFLDYDEDGNLDVYIANYGQWNMDWHQSHFCGEQRRRVRMYCSPKELTPEVHALYRANGDGTFVDKLPELGIALTNGRGQGVVTCDVNNDGHTDIYVANDLTPNFLFLNRGGGRFENYTDLSGAAYNAEGKAEAGMGTDAGDVDGDGLAELFVTNFYLEHNTMYRNLGGDVFQDVSHWSGVSNGSIEAVGWGTSLEDLDNDGWLDIFVTNGHVDDNTHEFGRDEPYAELPGLWRNAAKGTFEFVRDGGGEYFGRPHVGRGAAFGDLDNDGDLDIVVTHKDSPAAVLGNDSRPADAANAWVRLSLVGTRGNRDAIGARVEIVADGRRFTRYLRGGKSYLSAHDLRLTVGLGQATRVDTLTVHWPSGEVTEVRDLDVNRSHTLREPVSKR